jgi:NAD-dependent SIR2 family protein deacetylase
MTIRTNQIEHAAELVAGADALVVAAGAGMGVDSGLPDFRGNDGFWRAYPALAKANMNFVDVASPRTFVRAPAWHGAFMRVFTSNVDGQFQKAGVAEEDVQEYHGSLHHLQCLNECDSGVWSAAGFTPEVDDDACRLLNASPRCPSCGGVARPNVLMFNDWHWVSERVEEQRAREREWLDSIVHNLARVVVVEMGAGTTIPSVRHFSHRMSYEHGARIIRINPREPEVPSTRDVGIAMGSLEALRAINVIVQAILAAA